LKRHRYPGWQDDGMEKMPMPMEKMMPMEEGLPEECLCEAPVPGKVLAHSYVPWQIYQQAFSPKEALMKGTLFPELWGVYPIPK